MYFKEDANCPGCGKCAEQIKKQAITFCYNGGGIGLQTKEKVQPKRLGFFEPTYWFYKKILVHFNQLIPCSY